MPGTINDAIYDASKKTLCSSGISGVADAIEALEWSMDVATGVSIASFPLVRPGGVTRYASLPATEHTPAIVIVFAEENYAGTVKWLRLDVYIGEDDSNE